MGAARSALVPVVLAALVATAGCSVLGGGSTPAGTPTAGDAGGNAATATGTAAPVSTGTAGAAGTSTATAEPTQTPVVTDESGLVVVEIVADPPGPDAENLNGEYVVIKNTGDLPVDLSGWRVRDLDGHVHTFNEGVDLGIGETLTLHSGSGFQTETDRYWNADEPVWDNNGDRIYIYDEGGQKVYERPYDR